MRPALSSAVHRSPAATHHPPRHQLAQAAVLAREPPFSANSVPDLLNEPEPPRFRNRPVRARGTGLGHPAMASSQAQAHTAHATGPAHMQAAVCRGTGAVFEPAAGAI